MRRRCRSRASSAPTRSAGRSRTAGADPPPEAGRPPEPSLPPEAGAPPLPPPPPAGPVAPPAARHHRHRPRTTRTRCRRARPRPPATSRGCRGRARGVGPRIQSRRTVDRRLAHVVLECRDSPETAQRAQTDRRPRPRAPAQVARRRAGAAPRRPPPARPVCILLEPARQRQRDARREQSQLGAGFREPGPTRPRERRREQEVRADTRCDQSCRGEPVGQPRPGLETAPVVIDLGRLPGNRPRSPSSSLSRYGRGARTSRRSPRARPRRRRQSSRGLPGTSHGWCDTRSRRHPARHPIPIEIRAAELLRQ